MTNIELDFIKTYMIVNKKTSEFNHKLGAMRDMCDSCKLGVSERDNVLYSRRVPMVLWTESSRNNAIPV
jgi:hypothetical protein